jgi:hypothetical protein
MPETARVAPIRTPLQYYRAMAKAQRQCRSRVFHRFPDLDPDEKRLPPGFRVLYHDDLGNYFLQETCECCGRIRFSVSVWDDGHFRPVPGSYRYADPEDENWVHVPAGVLTAGLVRGFLQDECAPLLRRAARAAETEARAAARQSGTARNRVRAG